MEKSNSHISYICHLKRELHTYLFLIKPYTLLLLSIFYQPYSFDICARTHLSRSTNFLLLLFFSFFLGNTETEETGKITKEDF